jgi:6-phosphogluconolactonase
MAPPREILIDTPARLGAAFVARFEQAARDALAVRGRFAVAIPGGSVLRAFAPALAAAAVDWPCLDVFWCDERAVPTADPESNYGLASRLWLSRLSGVGPRVHPMPVDATDLDHAAAEHDAEVRRVLGHPPRLDLILLGMGPDGHVCSLFPGHPALDEGERAVVAVHDAPKPPPDRLTITMPLVRNAAMVCVAAFGRDKADALRDVLEAEDSRLPAALALRGHANTACLLDRDAASLLSRF